MDVYECTLYECVHVCVSVWVLVGMLLKYLMLFFAWNRYELFLCLCFCGYIRLLMVTKKQQLQFFSRTNNMHKLMPIIYSFGVLFPWLCVLVLFYQHTILSSIKDIFRKFSGIWKIWGRNHPLNYNSGYRVNSDFC